MVRGSAVGCECWRVPAASVTWESEQKGVTSVQCCLGSCWPALGALVRLESKGGVLVDGVSFEYVDFSRALWSVSCCTLNLCSASTTVGARFYLELPAVSLMAHT